MIKLKDLLDEVYVQMPGDQGDDEFGSSISIIVNAHYTRVEKLGIEKDRL